MNPLHLIEHPIAADRLRTMRDQATGREEFVSALEQLSSVMAVEATARLQTLEVPVRTPLEETQARKISQPVMLVPILRSGLGMLRGFQRILPEASVAFFGASRNEETLKPVIYLDKIPPLTPETAVFILDPMLATGHSACVTISRLRERGARSITFVCCLASPEGIQQIRSLDSDVTILTASVDRQLNQHGFILPGLGDAGDRQFGG
ncbi:MAG: uracil phosphoribosyltransferase [Verrucomicrobium sp.]|nr:uracil phosphoribosyltransferase [Verrucomicrobium sp.]